MKKIGGTYSFKVKNGSGETASWLVDCKNGSGGVKMNSSGIYTRHARQPAVSSY